MKTATRGGMLCLLIFGASLSHAQPIKPAAERANILQRTVRPFLRTYCVRCHGPQEANADLRVDLLSEDFDAGKNAQHWKSVMDAINVAAMPPKEERQPSSAAVTAVADWILAQLRSAKQRAGGTSGVIRRLTNHEYRNTVRDLFAGMDFDPTSAFLDDEVMNGFDNDGSRMFISSYALETYLKAGERVAHRVIELREKPGLEKHVWPAKDLIDPRSLRKANWQKVPNAELNKDGVVMNATNYSRLRGSRFAPGKFRVPKSGMYVIRATGYGISPGGAAVVVGFDKGPTPQTSVQPKVIHRIANVQFELDQMKTYEVHTWLDKGDYFSLRFENGTLKRTRGELPPFNRVLIHSLELEGPIAETWPPPYTQAVIGDRCQSVRDLPQPIERFLLRAYRRPPTKSEVRFFVEHVERRLRENRSLEESLEIALQYTLASPEFLFLEESPGPLNDYAIASRLSYFLWSTMPDDQLFDLAAKGKLRQPQVLEQQCRRLLADPRSREFVTQFTSQWLGTRFIDDMRPDPKLFPNYDRNLEWSMVEESEAFFAEVLQQNLSVLNFLDSDFAMLNQTMAEFYGIPGVPGPEFRRVPLKPEYHRGGVMTQANMLRHTSLDYRTHPIRRGIWILENLLGTVPPPPPPDVPPIEPDVRGAQTLRERLAMHRKHTACAGCHRKIDAYGLALENFDAVGAWRDQERSEGAKGRNPKRLPIDASGELPNGRRFQDFEQFRTLLTAEKEKFRRCFVKKLLHYAIGRPLEFSDEPTLDALLQSLKQNDDRLQDLIVLLVQSDAFLTK